MRTCHNCESPVYPTWDYCPRCHADLAEPGAFEEFAPYDMSVGGSASGGGHAAVKDREAAEDPVDLDEIDDDEIDDELEGDVALEPDEVAVAVAVPQEPRLSPAVHAAAASPGLGLRVRAAVRDFTRGDGRLERLREARVPAWTLAVALAVFLAALFAVAGTRGNDDEALALARDGQRDAAAEVARLSDVIATAEATEADLRAQIDSMQDELAAVQGDAAGQATALGTLQSEADSLRAEVEQARADLEARDASIAEQETEIGALSECLGGMEIAIEFGRQGLWAQADQALQIVAPSCAVARGSL